jgi:hypothetical protein
MRYNVLYVEDMPKDLFLDNAYEENIDVVILKYYDDLIKELSMKDHPWDAVILDAFGKCNEDDPKLGFSGLSKATKFLDSLNGDKSIPYFIYTGEDEKFGGKYNEFSDTYEVYYEKGIGDEKLIKDIKKAIEDQPNAIIRQRYPKVFKLFKEGFVDNKEYEKNLINILKSIDNDLEIDDELYFNQLRQILEETMRRAYLIGLLHEKCLAHNESKVTLSYATRFLSGQRIDDLGIKSDKTHFPKIISDHVWSIITITNIGSHAEKEFKEQSEANLKEYRKMLNTPYLLYSLTFKLMDVLLWFSEYIKENDNIELNKSLWVDLSETDVSSDGKWIIGTVTRIAENGWGTFAPDESTETIGIPPSMVRDNSIEEYQKIEVITKPNSDGTKQHIESIKTHI